MWSLIEVVMPDYIDGKDVLSIRPEPGRPLRPRPPELPKKEEPKIDTNAIIDAVIKGIADKMPKFIVGQNTNTPIIDTFDNGASLDRLADAMTMPKENEGKVSGIGIIRETKADEKETKKTIDILSKLGD